MHVCALQVALAQQMQDRLKQQQRQQGSLTDQQPLVVSSKPDAAALMATKRKQQAQYRWVAANTCLHHRRCGIHVWWQRSGSTGVQTSTERFYSGQHLRCSAR